MIGRVAKGFYVWKKCIVNNQYYRYTDVDRKFCLVKLYIQKGSYINHTSHKCRASKAKVIEIRCLNTNRKLKTAVSARNSSFIYRVGQTIKPTRKFDMSDVPCAPGIHYFNDEDEAREYDFC